MSMPIHFAPLQGYTDDVYRRIHHERIGGIETYYTPFLRMEGGGVRTKDMRDIRPSFNEGVPVVPQIIMKSMKEFDYLVGIVEEKGYKRIDLNMGCPFPMQAKHGRGSGLLAHTDIVEEICKAIQAKPELEFSVKMRLGWESKDEWRALISILNDTALSHVTMHPRLGIEQYKKAADVDAFAEFVAECKHPVVYNGDVTSLADIQRIESLFPTLDGVMIGRGLLANPALGLEYRNGCELTNDEMRKLVQTMHDAMLRELTPRLQGNTQFLSKMKPYWEYLLPDMLKRDKKAILKATTIEKYMSAVGNALASY